MISRHTGWVLLPLLVVACATSDPKTLEPKGTASGSQAATTPPEIPQAPTTREQRVLNDFVAFANAPSAVTAERIPFSTDGVQIRLGPRVVATLTPESAQRPNAWTIEGDYAGRMGPFSALTAIARHVDGNDVDPALRTSGELSLTAGPHSHCASPPDETPPELQNLRQVSIQPAERSITSCLGWFSVDLFLTTNGSVRAATVDFWEP